VTTGGGEDPQWLYSVVFEGRELWGDAADVLLKVSIEAFEPYLVAIWPAFRTASLSRRAAYLQSPKLRQEFLSARTVQSFASPGVFDRPCFAAAGYFHLGEWAETLGRAIRHAQQQGDPDTGQNYYRHWLAALERLVADKRLSDPSTLARYRDAWTRAASRTPHGAPIELMEADFVNDHSALNL
jgi:nitrile hydratase accessory protein